MVVLLVVAAAALLLSGCAKTIDDASAERSIAKSVREQVGAKVRSVACPSDVSPKVGGRFDCTVTGTDGTTGKATVTQKDDNGRLSVSAPFIHVRNLEQQIAARISAQAGGDRVDLKCPEIVPGAEGKVFDCRVTVGAKRVTVEVTQTDDQGHVRYKLKR
jgi:hypothetical protein